jgi:hypothetical protein
MLRFVLVAADLLAASPSPALADPTGWRAAMLAGLERTDGVPGSHSSQASG